MVIVWRLGKNIIRTALCWIVWHNVHSLQHTYVSSSYRSNRLGLLHWDPYAVRKGGCLELYYCNMVEWFWWDSSVISDDVNYKFSKVTVHLTKIHHRTPFKFTQYYAKWHMDTPVWFSLTKTKTKMVKNEKITNSLTKTKTKTKKWGKRKRN